MQAGSNQRLKYAVHQHRLFSRQGLLERLFTSWFDGFVYNQIWEDPRVDLAALEVTPSSRLLTISSGGCNVLNYAIHQPAAIVAVDLNPCHIYLTRLKLAAARHLPGHGEFFTFFGCADMKSNLTSYTRYLREHLDDATRQFWEGGSWLRLKVRGARIEYFTRNFYDHARLGLFMRFLHGLARAVRHDPARVLAARDRVEQERIYAETVEPFFDHWMVKVLGRLPFILFGLGIPPRQYEAIRIETRGQLIELYRQRVRRLACGFPLEDNYFTWHAFGRQYDRAARQALPEYLKADNFSALRAGVARVETHILGVTEYLRTQAPGAFDGFVLLDAQDWMRPGEIHALWAELARVGSPGARVIFRTASSVSPVEGAVEPGLRGRFRYERERSRALHGVDRSAIYGGFHLYVLQD